jgi:cell division protein FtsZ
LQELENEPAYKRKQMSLPDLPHSSESQVSRFTLSVDEGITEIKPNNSFLHDNVD